MNTNNTLQLLLAMPSIISSHRLEKLSLGLQDIVLNDNTYLKTSYKQRIYEGNDFNFKVTHKFLYQSVSSIMMNSSIRKPIVNENLLKSSYVLEQDHVVLANHEQEFKSYVFDSDIENFVKLVLLNLNIIANSCFSDVLEIKIVCYFQWDKKLSQNLRAKTNGYKPIRYLETTKPDCMIMAGLSNDAGATTIEGLRVHFDRELQVESESELTFEPQMNILPSIFGGDAKMFLGDLIPKLESNSDDMKELVSQVLDILPSLGGSFVNLENISLKLDRMIDKVDTDNLKDDLKLQLEDIKANLDVSRLGNSIYASGSIVFLVSASVFAAFKQDKQSVAVLAVSIVCVAVFAREQLTDLLKLVVKSLQRPILEPQSLGLESILTAATLALSTFGLGGISTNKLPKEIVNSLSNFGRIKQTVQDIFFFFYDILKQILDYHGKGAWLGSLKQLRYSSEAVASIITEFEEIQSALGRSSFILNDANFVKIHSLLKVVNKLKMEMPRDSKTSGAHMCLLDISRALDKLNTKFASSNFDYNGIRAEPVTLYLAGGPGVFKSEIKEHFVEALYPLIATDEEIKLHQDKRTYGVWQFVPENVYSDGYHPSTRITVVDDLAQNRDVVGNPDNEYVKFIRMTNCNPYVMHSAEIEAKGNTYYHSDAVIATGNVKTFKIESIMEPKAFARRLHFPIVVCPSSKYCTPETKDKDPMLKQFDKTKMPMKDGSTYIDPELMFEYHLFDPLNGNYKNKSFTFKEIILSMNDQIQQRRIWKAQRTAQLEARSEEYILERNLIIKNFDCDMISLDDETLVEVELFKQCYDPEDYPFLVTKKISNSEFIDVVDPIKKLVFNLMMDETVYIEKNIEALYLLYSSRFAEQNIHLLLFVYLSVYGSEFLTDLTTDYTDWPLARGDKFSKYLRPISHFDGSYKGCIGGTFGIVSDSISSLKQILNDIENKLKIKDKLKVGINWIQENKFILTIGMGILSYACYSFFGNEKIPFVESQSYIPRGTSKTARDLKQKAASTRLDKQVGGYDPSGVEYSDKIIRSNVYEFGFVLADGSLQRFGFVMFVKDRIALMPFHFITYLSNKIEKGEAQPDSHLQLRSVGRDSKCIFNLILEDILIETAYFQNSVLERRDAVLVRFPKHINLHRDVILSFISNKDIDRIVQVPFRLVVPTYEGWTNYSGNAALRNNSLSKDIEIDKGFYYRTPTKYGDCGAPFTLMNPSSPVRKFAGIHVAGNTNVSYGLSSVVTSEDLIDTISMFQEFDVVQLVPDFIEIDDFSNGQFLNVGTVALPSPQCSSSMIKKSELYGIFGEVKNAPAKLRPFMKDGVVIDPYLMGISKYCLNQKPISRELIRRSVNLTYDLLLRQSKHDVKKRVFSIEEAIKGLDDDSDFGSIPRNTSPGYPYNTQHHKGYSKKQWWLGRSDEFDLNCEGALVLIEQIKSRLTLALLGQRSETIYCDNLKDETRKIEKVDQGLTRIFSGCPMDYLVTWRMYFGAFSLFLYKNKIDNGCAIGLNPYSLDWTLLADKLNTFSDGFEGFVGAGDYKSFDCSQRAEITNLILRMINLWYSDSDDNQHIRMVLWEDLIHSKHIYGDMVYEWTSSLPSGHPFTLIVNYLYNKIAFMYCYLRAIGKEDLLATKYDSYIYSCFMGDDNIFSVHKDLRNVFNEQTLVGFMSELGLTYTNETKTASNVKLRFLKEVTFLKRGFRVDEVDYCYVAPLELESIENMLYWTKKTKYSEEITQSNVDNALREFSLHGKQVFQHYSSILLPLVRERLFSYWPEVTDYDEIRLLVKSIDHYW